MKQSLDLDPGKTDRDRPERPENDEQSIDCVTQTRATSFTADPSVIKPDTGGATIRWEVEAPSGCPVRIKLNGRSVSHSGTLSVRPAVTTRYTLTAHAGDHGRGLGSVTVKVDTDACISGTVPESQVRSELQRVVDELDRASGRFSQRSAPKVEVDTRGVHMALRFRVAVDNFADPDVNVDLTVGLRVRNGSIEPYYRSFAVDVDWPSWVTILTAGASKIVEDFLDGQIEKALKPRILDGLKTQLDAFVGRLPGNLRLHTLTLADDVIRVTACPGGRDTPFLVLPSVVGDGAGG